jgi:plastocyanin
VLSKYLCTILIVLLGLSIMSCSGRAPGESRAATQSQIKAAPVDPNTAATITGTVSFEGPPPNPRPIDMSNDPGCKGETESEEVVVANGHLSNVLVYVKSGLAPGSYDPPKQSISIKQEGCRYVPHMAALMVGQPVQFEDDDQTLHNIHPMPKNNREWNQSQMPNSQPLAKTFSQPELMIPIKCNQHPWMHMYLSVLGNPYFAVTGKDGTYSLPNLPPGTYTVAAVQEKYGEKTQTITVGAKDNKKLNFSYQP